VHAEGRPLLWRVGGKDGGYVFGTIHLSGPRETTLPACVDSAFADAGEVYCEIPLDAASQMKVAAGMLSGSGNLKETLPAELYARVEARLKQINAALTLEPFQKMPVWALAVTLALLEEQLKNPLGKPLDAQLYERAERAGKKVGGIETLDEQLAVLGGLSPADQLSMLRSTLESTDKEKKEGRSAIEELREAYLSGDLARLEATMQSQMGEMEPELAKRIEEALLTVRNRRMADRIAAMLKKPGAGPRFFAIGAGHLYGETGVVRLLQDAGLAVERVER